MAPFPCPVDTYHNSTYDAIDPTKPELSQKHKNVVITGAGSGIGQTIAVAFAKANASSLALVGRRLEALQATESLIRSVNRQTKVYLISADISDFASLDRGFGSFAASIGGPLHTLIANAGQHPGFGSLSEMPIEAFSNTLHSNAIGTLTTVRAFMPYTPTTKDISGYRATIIHTSTGATQMDMPYNNAYAVSKVAAAKFVQAFAAENPDVWVVNFHPGMIDSPMNKNVGYHFEGPDDINLPADWTVWAASKGNSIVPSGRYLWAQWDVNEIETLFNKLQKGDLKDGDIAMEKFPTGQRFTIGVSGLPAL